MGERHSDDGPPGRRRARPGGAVPGPRPADPDPALQARFGTALRPDGAGLDPEAERRAVAAFRAARDTGAHRARTRCRDDWRAGGTRRARFSVKATLSVFLASVALGGLAVAAIASAGSPAHHGDPGRSTPPPTTQTRERPGSGPAPSAPRPATSPGVTGPAPASPAPASPAPTTRTPASPAPADPADTGSAAARTRPGRPAAAKDTLANCRAYEQVTDRGKALDATAWQRLVTAAGGADKVAAYCAAHPSTAPTPTEDPAPHK
ncbi:hypothetical protein [Streptomyces sp. NPDC102462]|uniref:hypothetical protein n=1 Tax=Streptomyces sp. NPDC102462 TaxID=3366178 RepID=UPI00380ECCBB